MMFLSKRPLLQGFTLIELLIVLVLIGLSSAFVIPSMWQQLEQTKYHSEIAKIKSLFNYCRDYAYYKNTNLEVTVDKNILVIKVQGDEVLLKQVDFETLSFSEKKIYLDISSSFSNTNLTVIRNNGKGPVELEI